MDNGRTAGDSGDVLYIPSKEIIAIVAPDMFERASLDSPQPQGQA